MDQDLFENALWLIGAVARSLHATKHEAANAVLHRMVDQGRAPEEFRQPPPTRLAVLEHFAPCVAETMLLSPDLAAAIAAVEDHLCWRQSASYTDAVLGEGFSDNYGWCEIFGPNGFFPGDDFLLGLLMLGPDRHYRDHFHPAPELYFPLTGGTLWKQGAGDFHAREAGTVIWHEPMEIHATRTVGKPLLAVWAWTRDTATPARLCES